MAFKWLKKAYEQGVIASGAMLVIMYLEGIGVERDYEKARACFLSSSNTEFGGIIWV